LKKHVLNDTPKNHILHLAEDIDANVIIFSSHRPSIATYLFGSNAATVVYAKCSALVVR
jgi:universal stress protein F